MFLGQYRSKLQIIADILMVIRDGARGGARKTRIMYQANLSYRLLNDYLDYTLGTDLISVSAENGNCYVVTPKGFEFLDKYKDYSQRNRDLEEQLQRVANEKAILEKNYVKSANSRSRNSIARHDEAVESAE